MGEGRILITGATGFVGRRLVAALASSGVTLTLALRREDAGPSGQAGIRRVVVGEIGPDTDWRQALGGVGAVVHLAAHVHVAPERAKREHDIFDRVNHRGSVRLFESAAAAGVRTFVFLSSITVLGGASPRGGAFDDTTEPSPETPYGRSKRDAEGALREAAGAGQAVVILRPPLVAGPGAGGNLGSLARLAATGLPLPLGGIANRRTLLSLDNLVSAIMVVLDRPVPGTFVLGDSRPMSTTGIVSALRAGAGRTAPILPLPVALMERVASLLGRGGQARRLLGDLVADSSGFRSAYGWSDVVDTATTLRATGAAARAGRRASRSAVRPFPLC